MCSLPHCIVCHCPGRTNAKPEIALYLAKIIADKDEEQSSGETNDKTNINWQTERRRRCNQLYRKQEKDNAAHQVIRELRQYVWIGIACGPWDNDKQNS